MCASADSPLEKMRPYLPYAGAMIKEVLRWAPASILGSYIPVTVGSSHTSETDHLGNRPVGTSLPYVVAQDDP